MILTIDIGNTQTVIGLFKDGQLSWTSRIKTDSLRSAVDTLIWLSGELAAHAADPAQIRQSALVSVVPSAVPALVDAVCQLTGHSPVIADRHTAGIELDIDQPETLGSDRIISALAALCRHPLPAIIIDLGTATTISIIDADSRFIGGTISPGLQTAAKALHQATAQLPQVEITQAAAIPLIGNTTADCIRSGIIQGTAAMLDGMIDRFEQQLGQPATRIITGGLALAVIPYCQHKLSHEPDFLLEGLYELAIRRNLK